MSATVIQCVITVYFILGLAVGFVCGLILAALIAAAVRLLTRARPKT